MEDKMIHGCTNPNFTCYDFSCDGCPFDMFDEYLTLSDIKKYLKNSKKIVEALELLVEREEEEDE